MKISVFFCLLSVASARWLFLGLHGLGCDEECCKDKCDYSDRANYGKCLQAVPSNCKMWVREGVRIYPGINLCPPGKTDSPEDTAYLYGQTTIDLSELLEIEDLELDEPTFGVVDLRTDIIGFRPKSSDSKVKCSKQSYMYTWRKPTDEPVCTGPVIPDDAKEVSSFEYLFTASTKLGIDNPPEGFNTTPYLLINIIQPPNVPLCEFKYSTDLEVTVHVKHSEYGWAPPVIDEITDESANESDDE